MAFRFLLCCALALGVLTAGSLAPAGATTLGIRDTSFTVNGRPVFLLGFSYYGALGAGPNTWKTDLDAMQRSGFNWLRVWATWTNSGEDISAVDGEGRAREPYLGRLKALVADCDRRGMVVDVTLCRGEGLNGESRLQTYEAHERAVKTLLAALKPRRNWYLDLGNERNIRDRRFVPIEDLARLRERVKSLDPGRLVTASQGGDIDREELRHYVLEARLDFVCPHRPRQAGSAQETAAKTRELLGWVREMGRVVPVHYQEPFRRGYSDWQPDAADFAADLAGAREGGAAGWCFHNGDTRGTPGGRPQRSFDMRREPMMAQLDAEERKFVEGLRESAKGRR